MSSSRMTPRQSLDQLQQESRNLLYRFAESTRDMAMHRWTDADKRARCIQLASYIKRDLVEFKSRLDRIGEHHRALSGKVLAHPHHPEMLQAGGEYVNFIDDATAALSPMVGELIELLAADAASLEKIAAAN